MKNRMRSSLLLIIGIYFLSYPSVLYAQGDKGKEDEDFEVEDEVPAIAKYSLESCIQYAFEYSESIKKAKLDAVSAHADVGENLAQGLPQVSFEASARDNFKIPKSFLPSELLGGEAGTFTAVEFQPKFSGNAAVTLSQLIFDASYFIGLKAARMYEDFVKQQVELTRIDIAESVTKAYYLILIGQERLELLEDNENRLDTLLRNTTALNENGFAEKIDVMRTEVALNNIKTNKRVALSSLKLAKDFLKYQMGMPLRDSLELEGNLKDVVLDEQAYEGVEPQHRTRIEYQLMEKQRELQRINLQYTKSTFYPRLTGLVSLGTNTGVPGFGDYFYKSNWNGFGFYGLNLQIPLISGFRRKHSLQKVEVAIQKIEQDMDLFERSTDIQVAQAKTELHSQLLELNNQKRNRELAKEVSRVAAIKYQNGVGSNLEVIDAETSFKEAETNYLEAVYEALVKKVELEKALGKLLEN